MKIRRGVSKVIGLAQTSIGGMIVAFAFLSLYNIFNIQGMLGFSEENIGLYMWVFIFFGLQSVISGLILFYEQ